MREETNIAAEGAPEEFSREIENSIMENMQDKIKKIIKDALKKFGVESDDVHIEHPADFSHGDYATNIAMRYAPSLKRAPQEIANVIVQYIEQNKPKEIEKIEVAGKGFINFYLSKEFFVSAVKNILEQEGEFGKNETLKGKKVVIEYTDPNPFKEFHIGHLMSNAIGESLARIVEFSGAKEVKRANYQGDVGLHVAKAIWGKMKNPHMSWGEAYAHGAQNYEQNEDEIDEINKKIYNKSDPNINALYESGKDESLKKFEEMYKRLGTKFDFSFFENESGPVGLEVVKKHGDVFKESDGAVVFHGEKVDPTLHTRVFVTKEGLPTYEAKELGLLGTKHEKYPHDISYVVTGNEVRDYFRVVHKAMQLVSPELAEKTKHITHGMLRLSSGKMSSRTGEVVSAESLLHDVKGRVLRKMKNDDAEQTRNKRGTNAEYKERVAEQIAVGAVKYSILKQSAGNDIIFDFEKSLSFEGDSGPYLQYTHARARSVIQKANEAGISTSFNKIPEQVGDVERLLERFPETVLRAYKELEPHYITTYLTQLAGAFNAFYAKERIVPALSDLSRVSSRGVEAGGGEEAPYRLALTEAVSIVLKNGLWLLGITAPEKM